MLKVRSTRRGVSSAMYQFSRAIYRELAPHILAPPHGASPSAQPRAVLHACEEVVERMATDRHYFARPARTLFCDIRSYFPMASRVTSTASSAATSATPSNSSSRTRSRATRPSAASRRSAARRRARARPASACRCRTTATAPPTNTSPRPRTGSSRPPERLVWGVTDRRSASVRAGWVRGRRPWAQPIGDLVDLRSVSDPACRCTCSRQSRAR